MAAAAGPSRARSPALPALSAAEPGGGAGRGAEGGAGPAAARRGAWAPRPPPPASRAAAAGDYSAAARPRLPLPSRRRARAGTEAEFVSGYLQPRGAGVAAAACPTSCSPRARGRTPRPLPGGPGPTRSACSDTRAAPRPGPPRPPPQGQDPGVSGKQERASGLEKRTGSAWVTARARGRRRRPTAGARRSCPGHLNPQAAAPATPDFTQFLGPPTSPWQPIPREVGGGGGASAHLPDSGPERSAEKRAGRAGRLYAGAHPLA